jgi:hypothetical protein
MNQAFKSLLMTQELSAAEALTALQRSPTSSPPALPTAESQIPAMPALPTAALNGMPPLPTIYQQRSTVQTALPAQPQPKPKTKTDKVKKNFPQKLFEILETAEHDNVLKWLPGGKAFIIMDKKCFAKDLLPNYFKQTQFTSFTRKLSRWKFVRVPRGPFMGAYYHKLFRKDHIALCNLMSCNNEAPSLAVIAQARQQAMDSAAVRDMSDVMGLSASQQNALKSLQEINRASLIKDQLLSLQMKRAQLYEQEKRMLMNANTDRMSSDMHRMHQNQDLHQAQSRMIEAASRAFQGNEMSRFKQSQQIEQLAKLRQTGMLNRAAAAARSQMQQQENNSQQSSGAQQIWNGQCFRASAA